MRKFLMAVAVGLLVGAVAVPAMALDFQFKGAFRWRLYSIDGIGPQTVGNLARVTTAGTQSLVSGAALNSPFIKSATSRTGGFQGDLRFRPYVIVSDDNGAVQSHLRFEIGDVMFGDTSAGAAGRSAGGATGADGVNVETKWAFIDVQLPGGIPLRMRGGIQPWLLPKSAILDDDIAGIRFYGARAPFAYEFGWMAINQRSNGGLQPAPVAGPSNDDINAWYAKVDFALAKVANPYLYGVYKHGSTFAVAGDSASSDGFWIGAGSTGTFGIVKYDVDFVYGQDDPHLVVGTNVQSRNLKQQGWFLDGGLEFPIGPVALGARAMYATGDKPETTTKNEEFPGVMDSANSTCLGGYTANGTNELWWNSNGSTFFSWGPNECPENSWTLGVYGIYRPVKALKIKADYFYVGAAKSRSNRWTGRSSIGHEIALVGEYTIATGTRLWAMGGVLIAPDQGTFTDGTTKELTGAATVVAVGVFHDF